jgi:hypothetical protein
MKKIYLLVEGITDIALVKYICFKKGIIKNFDDFKKNKDLYEYENIVLVNLNGQNKLEQYLIFLKNKESEISKIYIIQDADNDFDKSMENINNAIENSEINQELISNDDIFLTPNNKDLGDLETLLLSTIKDNDIVKCFQPYKECLENNNKIYEKALNKGQVYAYTMYSQLGENLHKPQNSFMHKFDNKFKDTKLWDLDNENFKPIIDFILQVFNFNPRFECKYKEEQK